MLRLVLTEENTITGSGGRALTTYERYGNGTVSRVIYPNTLSIRRDYTARGQLSGTGWSTNNNWLAQFASYNYLADGKLNYQDYLNGMHTGFGYDDRGFLNQETISHGGQTYSQRTFSRDTRDRITVFQKGNDATVNPMENGLGDFFWYDDEGQLTDSVHGAANYGGSPAGGQRWEHFDYDALGNRRGNNIVGLRGWLNFSRRDDRLNQYSSWSPSIIYHDDNYPGWGPAGNGVTMAEGWITASYNALNQPVAIGSPATWAIGNWMWFGYDPLGRCVKRVLGPSADSGSATYLYYDGWSLIQEGPNSSGINQVYMLGNHLDDIVADFSVANNQWMYHHADARGHCVLLTDRDGVLTEQYEYDAFGHPYFFDASGGQTTTGHSAFGNRFLFTGREYLSDLHLYDYRNRLYQPELGRFLQPDPKQFLAGDFNLYRYCHNDPVNRSDPDGTADNIFVSIAKGMAYLGRAIIDAVNTLTDEAIDEVGNHPSEYMILAATMGEAPEAEGIRIPRISPMERLPRLITNPKHHFNSPNPQPRNFKELFNKSIADKSGVRWAKDKDGSIHRFTKPSNGESHWNGSTKGNDPIKQQNIPNEIKKQMLEQK